MAKKYGSQKGYEQNPHSGFRDSQPSVSYGKVVAVNQAQKTVDVVLTDGNGLLQNVPVLGGASGQASGLSYLPKPYKAEGKVFTEGQAPLITEKRDVYAVLAYVNGRSSVPVVIGFKAPELNQMSFPAGEGFENQKLDRHESDRYHRITGDTVEELGGEDSISEEELRYPDNSYFKVFGSGRSKALTNLTGQNEDDEKQKFRAKKEQRKGFYFQHSSGSRVLIGDDGEIKIQHSSGSWISMSSDGSGMSLETVDLETIESAKNPPTAASTGPVEIKINHSSGSYARIDVNGNVTVHSKGNMSVTSDGSCSVTSTGNMGITSSGTLGITSTGGTSINTGGGNTTVSASGSMNVSATGSISITSATSIVLGAPDVSV